MDYQLRNLNSLTAEFHNRGDAAKGLKNIKKHIKQRKDKKLANLLDHHLNRKNGYSGKELAQRFEIDVLIGFYNLLLVARIAGYIPVSFGKALTNEIVMVLEKAQVREYYTEHYPYEMTNYTLSYVTGKGKLPVNSDGHTAVFNSFAALNRTLRKDDDIDHFLGMLDYVWYDGYMIDDVIDTLKSPQEFAKAITRKHKNECDHAVLGFVKYIDFLSQLKSLMMAAKNNPLLQSAMWMFHGYYLDRMNKKMSRVFDQAFYNLQKSLGKKEVLEGLVTELIGDKLIDKVESKQLKGLMEGAINQAREDVSFMMDRKWGKPLKKYFRVKNGITYY